MTYTFPLRLLACNTYAGKVQLILNTHKIHFHTPLTYNSIDLSKYVVPVTFYDKKKLKTIQTSSFIIYPVIVFV